MVAGLTTPRMKLDSTAKARGNPGSPKLFIIDLDPTRGSVYGKQKGKTEGSAKRSGDPDPDPGGTDTHPGDPGGRTPFTAPRARARLYGPSRPKHAFTAPRARSTPLRPLRPKHAFTAPSARSTPLRPLHAPALEHAFTAPTARILSRSIPPPGAVCYIL